MKKKAAKPQPAVGKITPAVRDVKGGTWPPLEQDHAGAHRKGHETARFSFPTPAVVLVFGPEDKAARTAAVHGLELACNLSDVHGRLRNFLKHADLTTDERALLEEVRELIDFDLLERVFSLRGTSNSNTRGNTRDRESRRRWLLDTFRSNAPAWSCRCYRCGQLLNFFTVTVDRIVPGCRGGRYVRANIRPACWRCNSETGGGLRR